MGFFPGRTIVTAVQLELREGERERIFGRVAHEAALIRRRHRHRPLVEGLQVDASAGVARLEDEAQLGAEPGGRAAHVGG